jgi:hypothetical protein
LEEDRELLEEEDDVIHFKQARAGDHLRVPFQCELCHFRNLMRRNPKDNSATDFEMLDMTRQVNLDAFWSRESGTVSSNLWEPVRMERTMSCLGMPSVTPCMGPWPLEDSLGMAAALAKLDRSLDKGIYEDTVQWDTLRRTMLAVTNIYQATVGGLEYSVGAYECNQMFLLGSAAQVLVLSFYGRHPQMSLASAQT